MDGDALRTLLSESPILADGGMGTSLIEAGAPVGDCFELLNTDDPQRIERIHRGFVDAGADMVLTNTFGGNRFRLDAHGISGRVTELDRAAVAIARQAGGRFVAGSM